MAKVSLSKIAPIKKVDPMTIPIEGQEITVIQYMPVADKMKIVETVLNETIDDTGFFNPMRMEIFTTLEILKAYTNISITDKMMEDPSKVYDLLVLNKIIDIVVTAIPADEYDYVFDAVEEAALHMTKYMDSFVGMMKTVTTDYSTTKMNVDNLLTDLGDPAKIGLVKDILEKIG